jgi:hypothetical protein
LIPTGCGSRSLARISSGRRLGLGAGGIKATAAGEHGATTIEMPNVLFFVDRKLLALGKLISATLERTS